ncbi:MAG: Eco57I restriction-modification methylase domain-containing protein [Planctomycetota bacterium]|nr:Eco57I restriction-modification methylase domain-containing protein [Planctomycetota bacterium]
MQQIKPLPNLDYKIVVGNSLLGVEKTLSNTLTFNKLERLKPGYFDESDTAKKASLKRKIDDLIHELTNGKETFDYEIYFSEVFHKKKGFDVIIANPPYVRQEKIKELKPLLKAAGYECYTGTADLLVYFYERGVNLLRGGGAMALITSNKYYRAGYGEKLRDFLSRELTLHKLVDFGDAPVFEAIAYASILTGTRHSPPNDSAALGYTWEKDLSFDRITQVVAERGQKISQSELRPDGWRLESPAVLRLLDKLRRTGMPLGEYVSGRLYYGLKTGLNEAFVVDGVTRDRLIREHKSSDEVLKPFLRGRDVKRWRTESADLWLVFIPWHFPQHFNPDGKGASVTAEKEFKRKYPAIHKHLSHFKKQLMARNVAETGVRYEWYALQRWGAEYWQEFEQAKIVIPAIVQSVEYAPDFGKHYSNDKTSICITENVSFLLGLLNSKVLWWFIRQTAASKQGGFYEFKPMYVSGLPIPAASPKEQKPVEQLVDRILPAKQRNPNADVSAWEREIDQLVYALYGLTPEEIQIVEGAAK